MIFAEIIQDSSKPLSGQYDEIMFGISNDLLWVHFTVTTPDDYVERIGKFDIGISGRSKSKVFTINNSQVIVLSGGYLNLVDVIEKKNIFLTEENCFGDVLFDKERKEIISSVDHMYLAIYDMKGINLYTSQRVSLDGIHLERIQNGILYGSTENLDMSESNGRKQYPFTFDLEKRRFIGSEGYDAFFE